MNFYSERYNYDTGQINIQQYANAISETNNNTTCQQNYDNRINLRIVHEAELNF